jgi:methylated-DNA-[protein]-cysteine S-methyltransferase
MPSSNEPLTLLRDEIDTPIGRLALLTSEAGTLHQVGWLDERRRATRILAANAADARYRVCVAHNPGGASEALSAYFAGELAAIDSLAVASIGTPFQREVWSALRSIPCGTTLAYGELARRLRCPNAVRAVGLANGANPIGIVVPCHRVIGADGTLTGYGGGIERKRWLLAHERALPALELPFAMSRAQ